LDYLDFEIEIAPGIGGDYTVSVLRSPAGEASASIRFALNGLALENRLQALQIALLRSGGTWRRINTSENEAVRRFGEELWTSLFAGDVLGRLETSRNLARQREMGLRLKLRVSAPELAALPWEYLFDPGRADYLTLSSSTPLVRYIPLPQAMDPLVVQLPLRILAMVVTPDDLPGLDVEREKERLKRAVRDLTERGLVELVWLEGRTWRDLQQALRRETWHIFHFVGHGGFDAVNGEGLIVLADEQGKSHRLSATDLGRLLGDHDALRLAVLNSCESARADRIDVFSSTAATLVRRGTPAVVAMQYEITDEAAIEFSRSFYEAIADGMAVDASLAEARKGVALAIPNTLEWGTPVLFMRAPDGVLFKLTGKRRKRPTTSAPSGSEPITPAANVAGSAPIAAAVPVADSAPVPSPVITPELMAVAAEPSLEHRSESVAAIPSGTAGSETLRTGQPVAQPRAQTPTAPPGSTIEENERIEQQADSERRPRRRWKAVLLLVGALVVAGVVLLVPLGLFGPTTDLGGIDLETYCTDQGFDYVVLTKPQVGPNAGIDNLHCARAAEGLTLINLDHACQLQFGTAVRFAFLDRGDAFSGRCFDTDSGAELGGLDLGTYCANQGQYLAMTKPQLGQDAGINNFHCARVAEELAPISFEQACQAQYGSPVRFAFLDQDDAFSGRCFATGN
jgi:CHAT domain